VELAGKDIVFFEGSIHGIGVLGRRRDDVAVRCLAVKRVDEIDKGAVVDSLKEAALPVEVKAVPADLGDLESL